MKKILLGLLITTAFALPSVETVMAREAGEPLIKQPLLFRKAKAYRREVLKQELKTELYGELGTKLDKDVAVAANEIRTALQTQVAQESKKLQNQAAGHAKKLTAGNSAFQAKLTAGNNAFQAKLTADNSTFQGEMVAGANKFKEELNSSNDAFQQELVLAVAQSQQSAPEPEPAPEPAPEQQNAVEAAPTVVKDDDTE